MLGFEAGGALVGGEEGGGDCNIGGPEAEDESVDGVLGVDGQESLEVNGT